MSKLTKDTKYMLLAYATAEAGTCGRAQVGAVIVVDDSVASTGYNGAPRRADECDHSRCVTHQTQWGVCKMPAVEAASYGATLGRVAPDEPCVQSGLENGHCENAVHAEGNAVVNAARNGHAILGGTMYVTHAPCFRPCAPLLINSGIQRIVYDVEYRRDERAFKLYEKVGVQVDRWDPDTRDITSIVPRKVDARILPTETLIP